MIYLAILFICFICFFIGWYFGFGKGWEICYSNYFDCDDEESGMEEHGKK